MLALAAFIVLKPPYKHTSAAPANLNNQPKANVTEQPVTKPVDSQPPATPAATVTAVQSQAQPEITYPKGCEHYVALVSQYSWNVNIAIKVMQAESGCNPNAVGDRHIPPVSCGLFQIRTLAGRPTCEQLQNPETNVAWAYRLYTANGWQPWSVCRTKVACY